MAGNISLNGCGFINSAPQIRHPRSTTEKAADTVTAGVGWRISSSETWCQQKKNCLFRAENQALFRATFARPARTRAM
jgi:hypothetical protein